MTPHSFLSVYMLQPILTTIGFGVIALKPAAFLRIFFRRWPQTSVRVTGVRYLALTCSVGSLAAIVVRGVHEGLWSSSGLLIHAIVAVGEYAFIFLVMYLGFEYLLDYYFDRPREVIRRAARIVAAVITAIGILIRLSQLKGGTLVEEIATFAMLIVVVMGAVLVCLVLRKSVDSGSR